MTGAAVTIAWTPAEAVLFGPESRLVRLPLAEDDDRPALILETWRTEFPELGRAQLMAGGDAAIAPEAARLMQMAAAAGLRLEMAPPPGALHSGGRSRWMGVRRRILRPRVLGAAAVLLAALAVAGWQWTAARERERLSKLTAAERENELRRAESAETGRRRQASDEQARALLAACSVQRQFASEWLAAVGTAVPPGVVVDAIEINGPRCRLTGHTVAGAPGVDTAVEGLRQAIFTPTESWTLGPASTSPVPPGKFHLEGSATSAAGTIAGEIRPEVAATAKERLPDKIAVDSLLADWAHAWRIEAHGAETTQGVERRRYAFAALSREPRAWSDAQQLARRLNEIAGVAIDTMTLIASPGENGSLEKATLEVSIRVRAGH